MHKYSKIVGYKIGGLKLLNVANLKTIKSQLRKAYNTAVMYLSPAFMVGKQNANNEVFKYDHALLASMPNHKLGKKQLGINKQKATLCPSASFGCLKTCLFISGSRVMFKHCIPPTIRKAKLLFANYDQFFDYLIYDIEKIIRLSAKHNLTPCIRLNGTSDVAWEKMKFSKYHSIMEAFPTLQFYDYTKRYDRMLQYCKGDLPPNYYLTFSRTEANESQCKRVLKRGKNVAVCFRNPFRDVKTYLNHELISGDLDDTRFLDPSPRIVALLAKNRAKHDQTGFTIQNPKTCNFR